MAGVRDTVKKGVTRQRIKRDKALPEGVDTVQRKMSDKEKIGSGESE